MSNSYKYIDPDFTYTDPETGLLRNLQDITDPDVLLFVESGAVTKRLQELYEKPIKIKGIYNLFKYRTKATTSQSLSKGFSDIDIYAK